MTHTHTAGRKFEQIVARRLIVSFGLSGRQKSGQEGFHLACDRRKLTKPGVSIARVDYYNPREMAEACAGASRVVSALCGLEDVIIEAQSQLLSAAVKARVLRFIPSDFAIDFFKLPDGSNRNLDMRPDIGKRILLALMLELALP